MSDSIATEKPMPQPKTEPQIGCVDLVFMGILWFFMFALIFNTFVLFFPFFVILWVCLNGLFRLIRPHWTIPILWGVMLACFLSPIDITFRPSQHPRITVLPQVQVRDAYQAVRLRLEQGQRENVDFVVARSGCSGPTYPKTAIVVFYPSRYTTHFGSYKTPEKAEKAVQQTLEEMKKWKQQERERQQERWKPERNVTTE